MRCLKWVSRINGGGEGGYSRDMPLRHTGSGTVKKASIGQTLIYLLLLALHLLRSMLELEKHRPLGDLICRGTARLKLRCATAHQIEVIDGMMHPFNVCLISFRALSFGEKATTN